MLTEQQLSGRALDAEVAEKIMDHVIHVDDNEGWCEHCGEEMMEYRLMRYRQQGGREPMETRCVPEYAESITAVAQVEDRIAELGLEHEYAGALLEQTGNTQYQSSLPVIVWAIVRATPEERCRAALSVIETNDSK